MCEFILRPSLAISPSKVIALQGRDENQPQWNARTREYAHPFDLYGRSEGSRDTREDRSVEKDNRLLVE
jgi:hypothetical protein